MHHSGMDSITGLTFGQQPLTEMPDPNNNHDDDSGAVAEIKKDEKYSLRQRQSRRSNPVAKPEKKPAEKVKPKPKAAPLSKYRRKTANARERSRMREINSAFENLRRAVPVAVAGRSGSASPVSSPCSASNEKLTKITTLRLAMKYIRILSDILSNGGGGGASGLFENNNDLDMVNHNEIEREVMQKGLLLQEALFNPTVAPSMMDSPFGTTASSNSSSSSSSSSSGSSTNGGSAASRKKAKKASRSKKGTTNSKATNATKAAAASGKRDKISPMGPGAPPSSKEADLSMDVDLSTMLESDNDSLNLSEPCLSPLNGTGLKSNFACTNPAADSLEFGLLLESDADSLQLSEPCLSPLSHLDSLNPFNDLLHTGFNEQTALELYL